MIFFGCTWYSWFKVIWIDHFFLFVRSGEVFLNEHWKWRCSYMDAQCMVWLNVWFFIYIFGFFILLLSLSLKCYRTVNFKWVQLNKCCCFFSFFDHLSCMILESISLDEYRFAFLCIHLLQHLSVARNPNILLFPSLAR